MRPEVLLSSDWTKETLGSYLWFNMIYMIWGITYILTPYFCAKLPAVNILVYNNLLLFWGKQKHICRPVPIYKLSQCDSLKICRKNTCPFMINMLAAVVWCSMHGLTCLQGIQGQNIKGGRLFMPHTHCMGTRYWLFGA